MTDCRHGFDVAWCALCNGSQLQGANNAPPGKQCSAPDCGRWVSGSIGGVPLCKRHVTRIQTEVKAPHRRERIERMHRAEDERDGKRLEWVYFIRLGDSVKIGHTVNVLNRFRNITLYVFGELIALEAGTRALEKRLHRQFKEYVVRGDGGSVEIFELVPEVEEYIESGRSCATGCGAAALPDDVACGEHVGFQSEMAALIGVTNGPPQAVQAGHE